MEAQFLTIANKQCYYGDELLEVDEPHPHF